MDIHPIKRRRLEMGISQAELARTLGVIKVTVHRWECGVTVPHRRKWRKIEKVMGRPIADLMMPNLAPQA